MAVMEESIPSGGKTPGSADEELLVATQWQLIRWNLCVIE